MLIAFVTLGAIAAEQAGDAIAEGQAVAVYESRPLRADDALFSESASISDPGVVQAANLIYGQNKTSVCFADDFLAQIQKETNVRTNRRFSPVKLDSQELYLYPFAIMTGEGDFSLTDQQRENLRYYLTAGGFVVASPGCSNDAWDASFRREVAAIFPDIEFVALDFDHPAFHTVYDIDRLVAKRTGAPPQLEGVEIDGRLALVYSREGLNDTANAGPNCCCCGGNEIRNARDVNVNLLAYALMH